MKVMVCGSRTWTNEHVIRQRLRALGKPCTVMTGGARGADEIADQIARELGYKVETYPAAWQLHGKAAGPMRNDKMLDLRPDMVIAFWDGSSPGTSHAIEGAKKRNLHLEVIRS